MYLSLSLMQALPPCTMCFCLVGNFSLGEDLDLLYQEYQQDSPKSRAAVDALIMKTQSKYQKNQSMPTNLSNCKEASPSKMLRASEPSQPLPLHQVGFGSFTSKSLCPACKYGYNCYRLNPQHYRDFSHPEGQYERALARSGSRGAPINLN